MSRRHQNREKAQEGGRGAVLVRMLSGKTPLEKEFFSQWWLHQARRKPPRQKDKLMQSPRAENLLGLIKEQRLSPSHGKGKPGRSGCPGLGEEAWAYLQAAKAAVRSDLTPQSAARLVLGGFKLSNDMMGFTF